MSKVFRVEFLIGDKWECLPPIRAIVAESADDAVAKFEERYVKEFGESPGEIMVIEKCPGCMGSRMLQKDCPACHGDGKIVKRVEKFYVWRDARKDRLR